MYCLLADVKIREKTNNRRGLQDALRAIAQVGDLTMNDQPYAPDLNALWIDLGIQSNHGIVSLDDKARLGAARRALRRMPADHRNSITSQALGRSYEQ